MTSRVKWNGDEWARKDLIPAVEHALLRAGAVLETEMKTRMGSQSGGVIGKTPTGRNIYRAAKPGDFPGVRTGTLRRSISHQLESASFGRSIVSRIKGSAAFGSVRVGTNVRYGRRLELGIGMPARPWAYRCIALARDKMNREFTKAAVRSLSAASRGRFVR